MQLEPWEEFNRQLVDHVRPPGWTNPTPVGRYNLVAIGGGTAGIIAALGAAGLGGRAALVERHLLGGDCLNYGCVPSKALLRAARAAYQVTRGEEYGFRLAGETRVDFAAVMQRMRRLRARMARHDSAARFASLGVDVFLGEARFVDRQRIQVGDQVLEFHRAVIASGARAAVPNLEGLREAGFCTNETIFSLQTLPRRLIVLGGGPIGCELGQAFRRLGSEVHLVQRSERLLPKEEPGASRMIQDQLQREGLHLHLGWEALRAERTGSGKSVLIQRASEAKKLIADEILIALGRRANIEGLGLEQAGVAHDERGVAVNDFLRTTNRSVYAAGDVCSTWQFTHAAEAMARICLRNALFLGRQRVSSLVIPRTTYTDPEVAEVGLTSAQAEAAGIPIQTWHADLADVDRAILDGETEGFACLHTRRGNGRILGATVVATHAGEMLGELVQLITRRRTIADLANVIRCYPTQSEVLKRIASAYERTRLTPRAARLFRGWLKWRRS